MRLLDVILILIFIYPIAQADILCDPPPNIKNGKVSYLSLDFEAELHYECDSGFKLNNKQRRLCSDDGTWSGSEPICEEVECDPPAPPVHGKVHILEDKFHVGSMVIYTCNEGRTMEGSASSRCLDTGEWTFPPPRCWRPCLVPKINHGKIGRYVGDSPKKFEELPESSKIEDNEELYLRCEPNYEPVGKSGNEKKITCSQGNWEMIPVCYSVSCNTEDLSASEGIVPNDGKMVLNGESFNVKCGDGYSPSENQARCSRGRWNVTGKLCEENKCVIHSVDNGDFFLREEGSNWSWLRLIFTKQYDYRKMRLGAIKSPGSKAFVSCYANYTFQGKNFRRGMVICSKGKWFPDPVCLFSSCNAEDLKSVSENIVLGNEKIILDGELFNVRCREGYSPTGEQARCSRGQWNVTGKLCEENNCTIHKIENGVFSEKVQKREGDRLTGYKYRDEYLKLILGATKQHGSSVYLFCDRGYSLEGKQRIVSIKCLKGKWDTDPVCQIRLPSVNCSKFDEIDFVVNYDKAQTVNSTAVFSCKDSSKQIDGPNRVTCLSNGQWSGSSPKCKTPGCPLEQIFEVLPLNVEPVVENVTSDILPHNYYLSLICQNNLMLSGSNFAKCGRDGRWQVSKTKCLIGCGSPKTRNSELIIEPDKNFYRFGELVSLSCRDGYRLSLDVVRLVCLGYSWSELDVPECIEV